MKVHPYHIRLGSTYSIYLKRKWVLVQLLTDHPNGGYTAKVLGTDEEVRILPTQVLHYAAEVNTRSMK